MTAETSSIPIVDFAAWHTETSVEQRKKTANELVAACCTVGFVYIVNHAVAPERLAQAFGWSKKLFDLKLEHKMLAPHPDGFTVHRGYSWPGLEKVSNAMGDEEEEDLMKNLRQVSDFKVLLQSWLLEVSLKVDRRAMKLAVKTITISQINGFQNKSFPASEAL